MIPEKKTYHWQLMNEIYLQETIKWPDYKPPDPLYRRNLEDLWNYLQRQTEKRLQQFMDGKLPIPSPAEIRKGIEYHEPALAASRKKKKHPNMVEIEILQTDGSLLAVAPAKEVWGEGYWPSEMMQFSEGELFEEIWLVPENRAEDFLAQGTSDQVFSDGYEAYGELRKVGKELDSWEVSTGLRYCPICGELVSEMLMEEDSTGEMICEDCAEAEREQEEEGEEEEDKHFESDTYIHPAIEKFLEED